MKKATVWVDNKGGYHETATACAKADGWFKCPKCNGKGYVEVEYDAYPTGLPDSGWAQDIRIREDGCDLCNELGYTEVEKKPIFKVVGYQ